MGGPRATATPHYTGGTDADVCLNERDSTLSQEPVVQPQLGREHNAGAEIYVPDPAVARPLACVPKGKHWTTGEYIFVLGKVVGRIHDRDVNGFRQQAGVVQAFRACGRRTSAPDERGFPPA